MLPDRVSNPGPLTYEIALLGPAFVDGLSDCKCMAAMESNEQKAKARINLHKRAD